MLLVLRLVPLFCKRLIADQLHFAALRRDMRLLVYREFLALHLEHFHQRNRCQHAIFNQDFMLLTNLTCFPFHYSFELSYIVTLEQSCLCHHEDWVLRELEIVMCTAQLFPPKYIYLFTSWSGCVIAVWIHILEVKLEYSYWCIHMLHSNTTVLQY